MDTIAVDWSGARSGTPRHIWLSHVRNGSMLTLRSGRNRHEVIEDLAAIRHRCPDGVVVGLDFAFSFPAWFLHERGYRNVGQLWGATARDGDEWLASCQPPFWGRPGKKRPDLPDHLRRCEQRATVAGISAKSVFQIGGAGAVGTGSIRGMPHLLRLRQAGFSIWPFDPPSPFTVVEIYPRLLTGPVHKRNQEDRTAYLATAPWTIALEHRDPMTASEDAFDAGISALAMSGQQLELATLGQATDPLTLLEGDIWPPSTIQS